MSKKEQKNKEDKKDEKKIILSTTPESHLRQIMGLDTRDSVKKEGKNNGELRQK